MTEYAGSVAVVFKQNPLPFHKDAMGAAQAMLAAQRQGKAWEMHDLMFGNRKALGRAALEGYAQQLELEVDKFKADMDDPEIKTQIEADMKDAKTAKASGTPTFFVNGARLRGAQPYDKFKEAIDTELKVADALIAQGVPVAEVYQKSAKAKVAKAPKPK
jgi:protein-disulfide isomerase